MKILYSGIMLVLFYSCIYGQETDLVYFDRADSLLKSEADSLSRIKSNSGSDIDTVIFSSASDSLIYFIKDKKMSIHGDGKIEYKKMQITSANIYIDFTKDEIKASGEYGDSTGDKIINSPVLTEAGESYNGRSMIYNFKTGRGTMTATNTEIEGAYFTGKKIKKVDKKTYFIEDGIYTTCNEKEPHYYISAARMKMVQDEELVAEWIWLNFGGVPFPIPLPFGVFPIQSGRRSGIIAPIYGSSGTYGTYIGRFGYFWAISDYMDLNFTTDYYTRGSYSLDSRFRYAKRYSYTGSIEGSYKDFKQGETTDPGFNEQVNWRIRWYHNQSITPTMRLDANLEFLSSNFLTQNVSNLNDALRNEIVSNVTLSKTWEESGNSVTINYQRRQSLKDNEIHERLPNLTFSKSQTYPFRSESGTVDRKWYESFGYSYNGTFQNNRDKVNGDLKIRGGVRHNVNLAFSPKLGYLSITPRFTYEEKWYNKRVEKYAAQDTAGNEIVVTNDVKEINFVRTFSTGVSISTKFYGIFNSPIPGISSFRHTVTPALSYSYNPDFSGTGWGYYGTYTKLDGTEVKYNKYEREIFGGATASRQSNLTFNLGNIFEMKTEADPTDTTSKEQKIQLLNLNLGASYNFAADSLNFSDIRVNYRTQIGDLIDFSGSNTFTLYDYSGAISRVNKFLVDEGKGLLRMTSFNFSITTRISGEKLKSKETEETLPSTNEEDEFGLLDEEKRSVYQGIYSDRDPDFSIPWDISLSYAYNLSRPTPEMETKFSSLSGSLNFNLTPTWKFSVTGNYDMERKEFVAPQVRVSKDLHCWLMNFTWNPVGTFQGYRFEIRVKAPQLQDLKITKQDQFFNTSR